MQLRAAGIPAAAPRGRRTRSGTLRDNRRAAPSSPLCVLLAEQIVEGGGERRALLARQRRGQRRSRRATASISISRWRCASSAKSYGFDGAMPSSGASAACKRRDQRLRPDRARRVAQSCARLGSHAARTLRRARASQARRGNARSRVRGPRCRPAAGCRATAPAPASRCRACSAPCAPPSRHSGCLSSASSVGGSSRWSRLRRPAAQKCRPMSPSARRRRNRRSRDSSGRAPRSPAAPARGPASPAPPICPRCRASRIATAIASASISGLAASITARRLHAGSDLCRDIRLCQPVVPLRGRARRAHRLGHQHLAPARRRRAEDFDVAALDAEAVEQRVHRELWMVRGRRRRKLPCASLMPPINSHASSSSSVSSPGSTTAPCGSFATACRNFAVAGIEPVEPAAITGPS